MSERDAKCEALLIEPPDARCTNRARYRARGHRVCGKHRRAKMFAERKVVDWGAETITRRASLELLTEVMQRSAAIAGAAIEQAVRESDWLWRRRFGDRKVRR